MANDNSQKIYLLHRLVYRQLPWPIAVPKKSTIDSQWISCSLSFNFEDAPSMSLKNSALLLFKDKQYLQWLSTKLVPLVSHSSPTPVPSIIKLFLKKSWINFLVYFYVDSTYLNMYMLCICITLINFEDCTLIHSRSDEVPPIPMVNNLCIIYVKPSSKPNFWSSHFSIVISIQIRSWV